jgi:capsular exopolysaccharide synthesis family protein
LLGILLPSIAISLRNLFRYKIEGHDDVANLTTLPIIADVPVVNEKMKTATGLVVQENTNNHIDEIFRGLRTNIQFMLKEQQKVILFTSSIPGEGKTFNSANLAASFALLGEKVILCGLDIRKPALGKIFSVSDDNHRGVTNLLTKNTVTKEALEEQILPSGVNENLDLLLAGPIPPNPAELLARKSFEQVINLLRQKYDYIILDTAPVGVVSDTLHIGRMADISIVVCRADFTSKSSFELINSLARERKLPNPSVVINGIDMSKRKYGYYYGYGRYGRYGHYGKYGTYESYGRYVQSHYGDKDDDSIKK